MFRPVGGGLVDMLRGQPPGAWLRPTLAGSWRVRDVVAHLIDTRLRRLSFQRDGMIPPPPDPLPSSEEDFIGFINGLNREWVVVSRRFSTRVLVDLFERSSTEFSDWIERVPLDAPALFPVSWAGEQQSDGWFDIGREFTELWHHQEQIRIALGTPSLTDARYLNAVLDISVRALPHAFRSVHAARGSALVLDISGPSGGSWTLTRGDAHWTLTAGALPAFTTRVRLKDTAAWKLLFNALGDPEARASLEVAGDPSLAEALIRTRSVIV